MARIKLELPQIFSFQTEIKVRISDLNYGQHVGNDVFLSYMHEARLQYFNHLGYKDEKDLSGVGIIMADSALVYKSEVFYGDILKIEVAASDIEKFGFDIYYRMTNLYNSKEAAVGKTGIVCFDYEKRKIATVPEELKERLGNPE